MMFWVFAALFSLLALALIVLPALRRPVAVPGRSVYDRAIYKDQLTEIDRDLERGVLSAEQAAAARLEVERRILATVEEPPTAHGAGAPRFLLGAIGLAAVIAAGAVYLAIGSPSVPDQPVDARVPPDAPKDFAESAERLAERLQENPDDGEGWLLLARTQAVLERYHAAADSYRRAMALTGDRADAAAGYGEMLVLSSNGMVTPAARQAFETAVAKDPSNAPARYYLALAAAQAGRPAEAIEAWRKLEAEAPPDAPWRASLRERIEEAAREAGLPVPEAPRGPSSTDIAAAQRMSPEERQKMVRSMVENLAARLEGSPDDAAGWQRLGRAYRALGEKERAEAALARVIALRPGDKEALLDHAHAVLEVAGGADPKTPLPEPFLADMRQVAKIDPKNTEALWYLGLAAAQRHDKEEAIAQWKRLLALLPPEGDDTTLVQRALEALAAK
jgi:cytochrome c-type biogenesis protein CcmH